MSRYSVVACLTALVGCTPAVPGASTTQSPSSTPTSGATATATTSVTAASQAHPRTAHLFKSCAPWDGGAMALVVDDQNDCANGDRPRVDVAIWKELPLAAGKTYRFDRGSQEGSFRRCAGAGARCDVAKSAEVVFDTYDDTTATGHYTATFPDGSTVTESFAAGHCPGEPRCG